MGSERRFDYSVLGDAVNLAARLESQSRNYGVGIILGEDAAKHASGLAVLELDRITVKGKAEAVRIFTLLGDEATAGMPEFVALVRKHEEMLQAYRSKQWLGALAASESCRALYPGLEKFYDFYAARIRGFQQHPPDADWDALQGAGAPGAGE